METKDKIVLITGGANGLGFGYAIEFLRNGAAHVAILDLADSKGEESVEKLNKEFGKNRAIFIICDVTNRQQFKDGFAKVVKEFRGLDIVINNAGILDDVNWELTIDVNCKSLVHGTLLGIEFMGKEQGGKGGTIVNIGSVAATMAFTSCPVYTATKHAVIGLSRTYGLPYYYEKFGVRILTLCPGVTFTRLATSDLSSRISILANEEILDSDLKSLPTQEIESVTQAMMFIINSARSGSIWIAEGGKPVYEILIPHREEIKAPLKDSKSIEQEIEIKDKIVLVTGGANGIGFAYAKEFLRHDAMHVAILDLINSNGEKAANELNKEFGKGRAIFVVCDLAKPNEIEDGFAKVVKEFGGLDIVINNAGIMDDTRWEEMININFNGSVRMTLLGIDHMRKDKGGKGGTIVNVSSTLGFIPMAPNPIYSGTKHAIIGLSRSLGEPEYYARTGVRILTICPGATDTQLFNNLFGRTLGILDEEETRSIFSKFSPQSVENVVQGMLHLIRVGKSGSVWVLDEDKPAHEIVWPDLLINAKEKH